MLFIITVKLKKKNFSRKFYQPDPCEPIEVDYIAEKFS